jgi:two-component system response regulator HydG
VIKAADIVPESPRKARAQGKTLADIVDDAERQALENTLRAFDGSRERAAEALDISPTTLWRKMTRLGITFENR